MIAVIQRALARHRAVRAEAIEFVRLYGSRGANEALGRASAAYLYKDRQFWLAVAERAQQRHSYLSSLDTATRYEVVRRLERS